MKNKELILLNLLMIAFSFITVGYASINSITSEIKGTAVAKAQTGVFITDDEYISDVDANTAMSEIQSYYGTIMKSKIVLSDSNGNSEIKYAITFYNNSNKTYRIYRNSI